MEAVGFLVKNESVGFLIQRLKDPLAGVDQFESSWLHYFHMFGHWEFRFFDAILYKWCPTYTLYWIAKSNTILACYFVYLYAFDELLLFPKTGFRIVNVVFFHWFIVLKILSALYKYLEPYLEPIFILIVELFLAFLGEIFEGPRPIAEAAVVPLMA